jgi:hypothetical protein
MKKLDREEAAAYLHLSAPWRTMTQDERLEWCERARALLAQGYNQRDIGEFAGIDHSTIQKRLAWSEGKSTSGRGRHDGGEVGRVRSGLRNPTIAAEALADPKTRRVVEEAMFAEPVARARRNRQQLDTSEMDNARAMSAIAGGLYRLQQGLEGLTASELDEDQRSDLKRWAGTLRTCAKFIEEVLSGGVSDEALAHLLEEV